MTNEMNTKYKVEYKWTKDDEWSDYFIFEHFYEAIEDVKHAQKDPGIYAYRILDENANIVDEDWNLL